MPNKIPIGVLGATGMVGQRFVQLLEHHPWFEVAWLAASERSSGLPYAEAARWKLNTPIPEKVAKMRVSDATPDGAPKVIFAALDAGIAKELEPKFAEAGHAVITNSSAFRMHEDVPLVIPEVNGDHLKLIEKQPTRKRNGGFIATNPNCSAIGLVMALAPLHRKFGIEAVFVATMQAVSGAGYPGVASLDILGNLIPYIGGGEEEKIETETLKILGQDDGAKPYSAVVSAQVNRVPVIDGHTMTVSVELAKKPETAAVVDALRAFQGEPQTLKLPTAPRPAILVMDAINRPQPRLDADLGGGMMITVGRVRPCPVLSQKFVALGHNTIRGAAGASVLNAELMKAKGLL